MADLSGPGLIGIGGDPSVADPVDATASWLRDQSTRGATLFELQGAGLVLVNRYFMRAWNTNLMQRVHWTVLNTPDDTGERSPYDPGDLVGIVVLLVAQESEECALTAGLFCTMTTITPDTLSRPDVPSADINELDDGLPFAQVTPDP